jgi:hypothetical protein
VEYVAAEIRGLADLLEALSDRVALAEKDNSPFGCALMISNASHRGGCECAGIAAIVDAIAVRQVIAIADQQRSAR